MRDIVYPVPIRVMQQTYRNILVERIPLVPVVLRPQHGKRPIGDNLPQYHVQPVILDGYRIALHQVKPIVIPPLPALYDPESRLVLSIRPVHPAVQRFLRRGNVQIELLGYVRLDRVYVVEAATPPSGAEEFVHDRVDRFHGDVVLREGLGVEEEEIGGGGAQSVRGDVVEVLLGLGSAFALLEQTAHRPSKPRRRRPVVVGIAVIAKSVIGIIAALPLILLLLLQLSPIPILPHIKQYPLVLPFFVLVPQIHLRRATRHQTVPTGERHGQCLGLEFAEWPEDGQSRDDAAFSIGEAILLGLDLNLVHFFQGLDGVSGGVVGGGDVGMIIDEVGIGDIAAFSVLVVLVFCAFFEIQ
mmetsp:Transcript_20344/g.38412  ORF Transcript_20344/g.38412 Transcript_20344/m.38412 type:complete len:356 (-) Transcript_20344:292-1359(-)